MVEKAIKWEWVRDSTTFLFSPISLHFNLSFYTTRGTTATSFMCCKYADCVF